MEWFILALMRAVFVSGKEASIKLSLLKSNSSVTASAFFMAVMSSVLLMPYVLLDGSWQSIHNEQFLHGVIGNITLNTFGQILLLTTIRRFDISYVSAILATSPLIFGGFSIVFLGQSSGLGAFLLMILIAAGGIFVELSRQKAQSFKSFLLDSGWVPIVGYLCIAAGATVFSKIAVTHGDPEAYIAFRYSGLSVVFFIIHCVHQSEWGKRLLRREQEPRPIKLDKQAMIAGLFLMLAVICEMNALRLTDMARVEAISKFAIVFTLFIDAFFISKRVPLLRWLGVALIVAGGVGVVLF